MKKLIIPILTLISSAAFSQQKPTDSTTEKRINEVIIVASSRTDQKIENSPQKVEVLGKEDMQEESGIPPSVHFGHRLTAGGSTFR
ncbi:hypothetical protein [Chryseobacterium koreense]|uniref:hypothetical protein n=1 Tax=Chryseobacterium koreense TaxID=232216 RepID=UPI0026ECD8C7|nr:hypothetical protein [Chryseobacterium koreense]